MEAPNSTLQVGLQDHPQHFEHPRPRQWVDAAVGRRWEHYTTDGNTRTGSGRGNSGVDDVVAIAIVNKHNSSLTTYS